MNLKTKFPDLLSYCPEYRVEKSVFNLQPTSLQMIRIQYDTQHLSFEFTLLTSNKIVFIELFIFGNKMMFIVNLHLKQLTISEYGIAALFE